MPIGKNQLEQIYILISILTATDIKFIDFLNKSLVGG